MTDTDHPALSLEDIATLTGNIVNVSADRPTTRADLDRLTAYIEYLCRMGCDGGCGRRVAYVNHAGRVLCWPCADGPRVHSDADELAERYHRVAASAEGLDPDGDPNGEATAALMADVLAIVGENPELAHSQRVRTIAAHAIPAHAGAHCKPPASAAHLLEPLDDGESDNDDPEPYGDVVDALAEAASWVARWHHERSRAESYAAALARVDELHRPYTDEHGRTRCRGCIAGYDQATGELTNCAWPCPTERARRGDGP